MQGNFQHVGKRRSLTLGRRYERPRVCTIVVDRVPDAHLVLVFRTKLTWQKACDSIFDAKFAATNLTAQNGAHNPIAVAVELLHNRQFASVIVAAEQGDHILGEVINHQMASFSFGRRGIYGRPGPQEILFVSIASATESFRSTCGPERGAPECSKQRSPGAKPHVG